jgi:hypothetical protein
MDVLLDMQVFRPNGQSIGVDGGFAAGDTIDTALREGQVFAFASFYLAVGIANSGPLAMLSGQRCMMDFCLV